MRPVREAELPPEAWAMAVGAVAAYVPREGFAANVLLVAAVLTPIAVPSVTVWAAFGGAMRRVPTGPVARRRFNAAMAAAWVVSLHPLPAGWSGSWDA